MTKLRAIRRLLLLSCLTLVCYVAFLTGKLVGLTRRGNAWRNGWFRRWARGVCVVLGIRTRAIGSPPRDVLIVSNHVSYIDIPVIASFVDAVFVAKSEVRDWPLIGAVCSGIDTIFINRESKRDVVKVGEEMEARLAAGFGVVFFPEGTSSSGEQVLPFKPSLLEVAARDLVPVHHATVRYRTPDDEPGGGRLIAWIDDDRFLPHVWRLVQLREICAEVIFGDEPTVHSNRKILAETLRQRVASLLTSL